MKTLWTRRGRLHSKTHVNKGALRHDPFSALKFKKEKQKLTAKKAAIFCHPDTVDAGTSENVIAVLREQLLLLRIGTPVTHPHPRIYGLITDKRLTD